MKTKIHAYPLLKQIIIFLSVTIGSSIRAESNGLIAISNSSCRAKLSKTPIPISQIKFETDTKYDVEKILQARLLNIWLEISKNPKKRSLIQSAISMYEESYDPALNTNTQTTSTADPYISPRIGRTPTRMWGVPSEKEVPDAQLLYVNSPASQAPQHRINLEIMSERGYLALALSEAQTLKKEIEALFLTDLEKLTALEEISDSGLAMLRLSPSNLIPLPDAHLELLANPIIIALGKLKSRTSFDTLEKLFNGLGHYSSQTAIEDSRYSRHNSSPSPILLLDSLYAINPQQAVELFISKMKEVKEVHHALQQNKKAELDNPVWRYMHWPYKLWQRAMGANNLKGIFSAADRKLVQEQFTSFDDIEVMRDVGAQ